MIKFVSIALIIHFNVINVSAQFLNLQITIEPELSASVESDLSFGDLAINSGTFNVGLGDIGMGVFNIKAYHTQSIFISLDYPPALTHPNPTVIDQIPIDISMAYNNSGTNKAKSATILTNNAGYVPLNSNTHYTEIASAEIWKSVYIYVFGSISVGNITQGEYSGDVVLHIEYD